MFCFRSFARLRWTAAISLAALVAVTSTQAALAVDYSIVDLGAPASNYALYYEGGNVYVNDTGQAIGLVSAGSSYPLCIVYNAGAWIPLEKPNGLSCAPAQEGLSDAGKSGTFFAVGQIQLPTVQAPASMHGANNMFVAKVGVSSAKLQSYGQYSESAFDGINENGLAAGYTDYLPMSGWEGGIAALTQQNGGALHFPLQPNCATGTASGEPCLSYPLGGGRVVNKSGTVLGYITGDSTYNGTFAEVSATTGAVNGFQLPNWNNIVAGIDDKGDVVYMQSGGGVYSYDPANQKATELGRGSGCSQQIPQWVNGRGDVLAYFNDCSSPSNNGWYLWTTSSGSWSAMTFGSAPNGCSSPFFDLITQMNDKDQFALPMACGSLTHWALLCPSGSSCGGSNATRLGSRYGIRMRSMSGFEPAYRGAKPAAANRPAFSSPLDEVLAARPAPSMRSEATSRLVQRIGAAREVRSPLARESKSYSIDDIGSPPASLYSEGCGGSPSGCELGPITLNDTGQIVGQAYPNNGYDRRTCLAWTGSAWVNFGPSDLAQYGCYPSVGITDAKNGAFHSVGATSYPTIGGNRMVGYDANVGASSGTMTIFDLNSPSVLTDMNAKGTADGQTYYGPFGGWYDNVSSVTSTGKKMQILQKKCAGGGNRCMLAPAMGGSSADTLSLADCNTNSYGVRSISTNGTVFGCSDLDGYYVEANGSKAVDFTLPLASGSQVGSIVGIDDKGNVIYEQSGSGTSWIYDPSTGTSASLGSLAGSSCTEYVPISVNASGEVLGEAANCSKGDNVYWTWTSASGMQAVSVRGSEDETFAAFWLNDDGQILVELSGNGFSGHWGILSPPGSNLRRSRSAFGAGSLRTIRMR
jgi:hypothetical protein